VADLTQARRLLDYEPHIDLTTGLRRLMDNDPQFSRLARRNQSVPS
jgi:hypothetical protein